MQPEYSQPPLFPTGGSTYARPVPVILVDRDTGEHVTIGTFLSTRSPNGTELVEVVALRDSVTNHKGNPRLIAEEYDLFSVTGFQLTSQSRVLIARPDRPPLSTPLENHLNPTAVPDPPEAIPLEIIVALAQQLGGGKIHVDAFDLQNAKDIIEKARVQIHLVQDPPQVVIEIKEEPVDDEGGF